MEEKNAQTDGHVVDFDSCDMYNLLKENVGLKLDLILKILRSLELKPYTYNYKTTIIEQKFKCKRCKEEKTRSVLSSNDKIPKLCGMCENELIEEYEPSDEDIK